MGKICRITIFAFLWQDIPKGIENGYGDGDLENGIEYCKGLIDEGLVYEPLDGFKLTDYISWAEKMIKTP